MASLCADHDVQRVDGGCGCYLWQVEWRPYLATGNTHMGVEYAGGAAEGEARTQVSGHLTLLIGDTMSKKAELIEAEEAKVAAFIKKENAFNPKNLRAFITKAYEAHEDFIERYDGWRWHGSPQSVACQSEAEVDRALYAALEKFRLEVRGIEGMQCVQSAPTRYALGLTNSRYADDAWEVVKVNPKTNVTYVPEPLHSGRMWADRLSPYALNDYFTSWASYAPVEYTVSVRAGQSVARAVMAQVKKLWPEHKAYHEAWLHFFAELGQMWSTTKQSAMTLSVAPSTFLKLGHYGESSCYRTGSDWENAKFNLANMEKSAVALFYRDGDLEPVDGVRKAKVMGRAWGMVHLEEKVAAFDNWYLLPINALSKTMALSLPELVGGGPEWAMERSGDTFYMLSDNGLVYINGAAIVFAEDKTRLEKVKLVLEGIQRKARRVPLEESSGRGYCYDCDSSTTWLCDGCDRYYCEECLAQCSCGAHMHCTEYSCAECGDSLCPMCAGAKYCTDCVWQLARRETEKDWPELVEMRAKVAVGERVSLPDGMYTRWIQQMSAQFNALNERTLTTYYVRHILNRHSFCDVGCDACYERLLFLRPIQ